MKKKTASQKVFDDMDIDEWIEDQAAVQMGEGDSLTAQTLRKMAVELIKLGYEKGWNDAVKEFDK